MHNVTLILSIAAICVSGASMAASFGQWWAMRQQIRVQNMLQIWNYLHQSEFREARHVVRNTDREKLNIDDVRKVCSSFDFAGLFLRHGLMDRAVFMEYWGQFLRYLSVHLGSTLDENLFGNISVRGYYRHFDWLLRAAAKQKDSYLD